MKVLILGGTGMLGHKVYQVFQGLFDTWISTRSDAGPYARCGLFDPAKIVAQTDLSSLESAEAVVKTVRPDAVINCVGILKQTIGDKSPIEAITLNSLLPHWLERLSATHGFRLIQLGTDCVFSGRRGLYNEQDEPDPIDLYGTTKLLGEVTGERSLTLRTSMIGRELQRSVSLLEWFLAQQGKTIQGYKSAIFSGFTTRVLAGILADILQNLPDLSGLYHISSPPISKYDLLCLVRDALKLDIRIEANETFVCDRSLDSAKLCEIMNYHPPSWADMIAQLATEVGQYEQWRAAATA